MSIPHCFHSTLSEKETLHTLSPEEGRHLIQVLRYKKGDPVCVFNGKGLFAEGIIKEDKPNKVVIESKLPEALPKLLHQITLAQAMPKGKGMDSVIRRATELGIQRIIPLVTDHTELRIQGERRDSKIKRWESPAIEGCKQSKNLRLVEIGPIQSFQEFIKTMNNGNGVSLIASLEPERKLLKDITIPKGSSITWLIGPEGDLSPKEYQQAREAGFLPIKLAEHILRVETAVVYALSILDYELQQLKG